MFLFLTKKKKALSEQIVSSPRERFGAAARRGGARPPSTFSGASFTLTLPIFMFRPKSALPLPYAAGAAVRGVGASAERKEFRR